MHQHKLNVTLNAFLFFTFLNNSALPGYNAVSFSCYVNTWNDVARFKLLKAGV